MAGWKRREFLKGMAAGAAVVSIPGVGGLLTERGGLAHAAAPPSGGYFEAFGVTRALLRKILAKGMSRGGDFCEVFLQHQVRHWLGLQDGEVNRAYAVVDLGAGVRVLEGDATGYAYSEELDEASLLKAASTAAAVADGGTSKQVPPLAAVSVKRRYAVDVPWTDVGVERKLPIVQRADAQARAFDPRIHKVTVFLNDETSHILVADTEGRIVEDDQPMALLSVSCVAQQGGKTETSSDSTAARDGLRFLTHAKVDEVARRAAEFTTRLFGATSPPAGAYPIVLAPGLPGILLHEAIGHGMEADFNRKGVSIYADLMGKRVAPKGVTIVDDGTDSRLRGSIDVDDEGTATERTVLVEDGILRSYLHDRISSTHYATKRTGSGRRQSFRFPPVPRMRNTYMLNGQHAPEEVIRSVSKGLYAENFTNGQVFIGAGDFTFYLKHGRLIEDGKLTRGVKDANLIGNGPKVLQTVDMVANDLEIISGGGYCGKAGQRVPVGFGLPTARVGAISVGGRKA